MLELWRRSRYVVPKRRYTITIIRCVKSQKIDLRYKLHTISVLATEISLLYYLMDTDMWTNLTCIVLCVTTWRRKICLCRTISKPCMNDITLSLSLITLLDTTVLTKIWASNIGKPWDIYSCAYTQILKISLRNLQ
jgi:hypothetical protein